MRLNRYMEQIKEDGEAGGGTVTSGGTTTNDVAQFKPKLNLASRAPKKKLKFKKKSKLLG